MNLVIKISWDDVSYFGCVFPLSYSNNTVWPLKNAVGFNLQTFLFSLFSFFLCVILFFTR